VYTAENTALTYVMADGVADNMFTVNSTTGVISTSERLDRETRHSWIITGCGWVFWSIAYSTFWLFPVYWNTLEGTV